MRSRVTLRALRVLLWKEWRQMRALLAALAIGGPVFILAAWASVEFKPRSEGTIASAAAIFLFFAAAALPAASIAGERRSGTLGFLLRTPGRRWTIFAAKLAVCMASLLLLAALASVVGRLCSRGALVLPTIPRLLAVPGHQRPGTLSEMTWLDFFVSSASVVPLLVCCLFFSAVVSRPTVALLGGALLWVALLYTASVLGPAYHDELGYLMGATPSAPMPTWHRIGHRALDGLAWAWLVVLGLWAFARARPHAESAWTGALRIAGGLGLTLLALLAPLVAGVVAELVIYARLRPEDARRIVRISRSPDGKLFCTAEFPLTPLGSMPQRCCLIDVENGKGRLLTGPELGDLLTGATDAAYMGMAVRMDGRTISPGGKWEYLTYGETESDTPRAELVETATGKRRELEQPLPAADAVYFSRDDRRLIWSRYYKADDDTPRFYVSDLPDGEPRPLPVPCRAMGPPTTNIACLTTQGLLFTCGGAAIYRIQLDGSGLERVFPGRQALTVAEFEADVAARRPR